MAWVTQLVQDDLISRSLIQSIISQVLGVMMWTFWGDHGIAHHNCVPLLLKAPGLMKREKVG
jgi:hypothetical protein